MQQNCITHWLYSIISKKILNIKIHHVQYNKLDMNNVLTDNSWFKIDKDSSGYMFAGAGLAEEGVEGVISAPNGLVTGHLAIRLDTVLETVQLPTGITDLDTGLSNVY